MGLFMIISTVLLLRVTSTVDKDLDHPQFFDPPYALKYIQAGLSQYPDISVHYLDCWIEPQDVDQMLQNCADVRPDLIVISASSFDVHIADEFAAAVKKLELPPLVVGIGHGYNVYPSGIEVQKDRYDAILLGEAEQEFFTLLNMIIKNRQPNNDWKDLYWAHYHQGKRFIVEDPDRLLFPAYTAAELRAYKSIYPVQFNKRVVWGFLIATRGCPHGCMFCSEVMRVSVGKRIRSRSASNVADELEFLARQGANICSFQDDSFSTNRGFVESLCRELIERDSKMPWMARARADELDYELMNLMHRAGCIMLGIGVESGSQRIIEEMRKQQNPKTWQDCCRQVFGWARRIGIGTNAYYVIGNPGETEAEIEQTIQLALELNSDSIQVHFYTPYPGSAAWSKYRNRLSSYDPGQLFHYATPMFSLAAVSPEKLVKLRSKFYRRYLFRPGFVVDHLRRHFNFYWHNPDILQKLLGIRKVL